MKLFGIIAAIALLCTGISGCMTWNSLQVRDEMVTQHYTSLMSVYQKRAELVPNLVETVKGAAGHESGTLRSIAEARAGVANAKPPGADATPEQLAAYDKAQAELRTAIAGAMRFTVESNPQLKANENFLKLQKQIQDTETQATAARNRYIREVASFNIAVRRFPNSVVANLSGIKVKPQLAFENAEQIKAAPKVKF